jgi:hypothetical protein
VRGHTRRFKGHFDSWLPEGRAQHRSIAPRPLAVPSADEAVQVLKVNVSNLKDCNDRYAVEARVGTDDSTHGNPPRRRKEQASQP